MISTIKLPTVIPGKISVSSMPGRYSTISAFKNYLEENMVSKIVSLTPFEEIQIKSPEYWNAIIKQELRAEIQHLPIEDYGVPDDWSAFYALVADMAESVKKGDHVLVHCGGGIGRAGTFSASMLLHLRIPRVTAIKLVHQVGSSPQTPKQRALVDWVAAQVP